MTAERSISLVMAVLMVACAYFMDGLEAAWLFAGGMILVLALIWFGDEMGGFVGGAAPLITARTPGWMLRILGWVILVLAMIAVIGAVMEKRQSRKQPCQPFVFASYAAASPTLESA